MFMLLVHEAAPFRAKIHCYTWGYPPGSTSTFTFGPSLFTLCGTRNNLVNTSGQDPVADSEIRQTQIMITAPWGLACSLQISFILPGGRHSTLHQHGSPSRSVDFACGDNV